MRWTPKRKRKLFDDIARAFPDERKALMEENGVSEDEFNEWARLVGRNGTSALRATRVQEYRRAA